MKIFISPANHHKPYALKGYTEKQQMELLAPLLKTELEKYENVDVYITQIYDSDQQYTGRPYEAFAVRADLYVALHTNASTTTGKDGKATGACVFYHPNYRLSKEIALSVVKEINRICPIKSNRAVQPSIYPWDATYNNLGELRDPARLGIPPVLIEHEFHDRKDCAKWIVESLEELARADAQGIAKALNLKPKAIKGDVNGDGEVNNIDASLILKYDAGIINLDESQERTADVNGDGEVNNLDAMKILKEDAGV